MGHHHDYYEMKAHYSLSRYENSFPESGFSICNIPFSSPNTDMLPTKEECQHTVQDSYHLVPDNQVEENQRFVYPVFINHQKTGGDRVIILLHGLNERDWDKYLPWARALHMQTKQPVILFPISFHVNRSPEAWKDPRLMAGLAKHRMQKNKEIQDATFLNAAISERLQMLPKRFYTSGLQTYYDLEELIGQLKAGNHPLLGKKSQVNFFGYSIGALLTQILLMANPKNMLKESRAFLFCGGASFDRMRGVSRFILDSAAFNTLRSYFTHLEEYLGSDRQLKNLIKKMAPGIYFRSMIDALGLGEYRRKRMGDLAKQLSIVTLEKDQVIPPEAVKRTFEGLGTGLKKLVSVMDLPYSYTHENVFPPNLKDHQRDVDEAFEKIFARAAHHLQ
jgi:pimeloyl-ACP methyl ester carboxylesterase